MVTIEPVKGGLLSKLPRDLAPRSKETMPNSSISSWALRWVVGKLNAKVVLSGMSTMKQVLDNLSTFEDFKSLSVVEQGLIKEIAEEIKARMTSGCTGCMYCIPRPSGLGIPKSFRIWNEYTKYRDTGAARKCYFEEMEEEERGSQCKRCGKCEVLCPQHIAICEDLAYVNSDMESFKSRAG